jgi:SPX domain protein involved in polyphosphate accumulation
MKFGKELLDEAREEWREKYINYVALKKKLWEVRDEVENPHANPGVLEAKRAIFQGCLDSEIEKVVLWYKSFLESLESNAKALERDLALAPQILSDLSIATDFKQTGVSTLRSRWRAVGTDLAHLLEYVSLNMIAMRKILKKYAKHIEPTKPMDGYCTLEIQHPDDPAWAFVQVGLGGWLYFPLLPPRITKLHSECHSFLRNREQS